MPWADSNPTCARRQVTTDPGAPVHHPQQPSSLIAIALWHPTYLVTGPGVTISIRGKAPGGKPDLPRR
jgi:hypothetical protein